MVPSTICIPLFKGGHHHSIDFFDNDARSISSDDTEPSRWTCAGACRSRDLPAMPTRSQHDDAPSSIEKRKTRMSSMPSKVSYSKERQLEDSPAMTLLRLIQSRPIPNASHRGLRFAEYPKKEISRPRSHPMLPESPALNLHNGNQ
jgi:hypothetical protein